MQDGASVPVIGVTRSILHSFVTMKQAPSLDKVTKSDTDSSQWQTFNSYYFLFYP